VDRRDLQGGPLSQERFEWDGMGKLRRVFDLVAGVERYRADYDGGGGRVRAVSNGVTRTYSGGLHEDDSNGSWTTHTPGVSQRANGTDSYFHSDWIGSTRYLTGANGLTTPSAYRFDGFGNVSAFAGSDLTRFKFAGGHGYESDAHAGLQQLGARLYDPVVGRFISPDPIGFAGGLNLYGYCGGNPVGAVDPSGMAPWWEDAGAAILNAPGAASKWAWQQWMKLWRVKLKPGTPTFANANPDSPTALRLRQRGYEISDGVDEMGGIVVSGLATGAVMAVGAGGTPCSGTSGGSGPLRVRHHTKWEGIDGIRRQGQIDPSYRGRPWGVDVEVGPNFGAPGTAIEELGAAANPLRGRGYVEFDAPANMNLTPTVTNYPRTSARIPTNHALPINGLNPTFVKLKPWWMRWMWWIK
jgi:RHS repeat-associated protein